MSNLFSPALLLNSCHSLLFKSHIYSQMAFILQGKENPGPAILSNLLKVRDKDWGNTGILIQIFAPQDSHTLALLPGLLTWKDLAGLSGWVLRTFP